MSHLAHDLAGVIAVDVHRRVSELCTVFQNLAADEDMPLTEVQAVLLGALAGQVFDGLTADIEHHLSADAGLRTGRMGWLLGHEL